MGLRGRIGSVSSPEWIGADAHGLLTVSIAWGGS
jgi:hypothetical protein